MPARRVWSKAYTARSKGGLGVAVDDHVGVRLRVGGVEDLQLGEEFIQRDGVLVPGEGAVLHDRDRGRGRRVARLARHRSPAGSPFGPFDLVQGQGEEDEGREQEEDVSLPISGMISMRALRFLAAAGSGTASSGHGWVRGSTLWGRDGRA